MNPGDGVVVSFLNPGDGVVVSFLKVEICVEYADLPEK